MKNPILDEMMEVERTHVSYESEIAGLREIIISHKEKFNEIKNSLQNEINSCDVESDDYRRGIEYSLRKIKELSK